MSHRISWKSRLGSALAYRQQRLGADYGPHHVFRLFSGAADGCAGVIIDHLGPVLWCRVLNSEVASEVQELLGALAELFPQHRVCLAARQGDSNTPAQGFQWVFAGPSQKVDALEVQENGSRYLVTTQPSQELAGDFGIYADSRAARVWVAHNAAGLEVVNLYSYTCAFGVVASRAAAAGVANIDVSREALTWGKRNAALNSCDFKVVPEDAVRYVERLQSRVDRQVAVAPGLVIADPPAFLWGRGQERLLRHALPRLLAPVFAFMPQGGRILLSCNDRYLATDDGKRVRGLISDLAKQAERPLTVETIEQTLDVIGQDPSVRDPWYHAPLFWAVRFL